jgi:polysaccharide deacetylase family protein (PEP-CTERM system associated)
MKTVREDWNSCADQPLKQINYLTIDFERLGDRDVYRGHSFNESDERKFVEDSLELILGLLEEYDTKASFFVVGEVIRDFPNLMKRIVDCGHEVGLHGWVHKRLDELSKEQFVNDIESALSVYEAVLITKPLGFRAPQFSMSKQTSWALNVLGTYGFLYDSSIYPCNMSFYGNNNGPIHPYYPSVDDPSTSSASGGIIEFPAMVYNLFGVRLPTAGGFWMRLFGFKLLSHAISDINSKGHPATIYFHNWEFLDNKPWLRKPFNNVRNYGIPIIDKIKNLLSSHQFTSIRTYFTD